MYYKIKLEEYVDECWKSDLLSVKTKSGISRKKLANKIKVSKRDRFRNIKTTLPYMRDIATSPHNSHISQCAKRWVKKSWGCIHLLEHAIDNMIEVNKNTYISDTYDIPILIDILEGDIYKIKIKKHEILHVHAGIVYIQHITLPKKSIILYQNQRLNKESIRLHRYTAGASEQNQNVLAKACVEYVDDERYVINLKTKMHTIVAATKFGYEVMLATGERAMHNINHRFSKKMAGDSNNRIANLELDTRDANISKKVIANMIKYCKRELGVDLKTTDYKQSINADFFKKLESQYNIDLILEDWRKINVEEQENLLSAVSGKAYKEKNELDYYREKREREERERKARLGIVDDVKPEKAVKTKKKQKKQDANVTKESKYIIKYKANNTTEHMSLLYYHYCHMMQLKSIRYTLEGKDYVVALEVEETAENLRVAIDRKIEELLVTYKDYDKCRTIRLYLQKIKTGLRDDFLQYGYSPFLLYILENFVETDLLRLYSVGAVHSALSKKLCLCYKCNKLCATLYNNSSLSDYTQSQKETDLVAYYIYAVDKPYKAL